MTVTNVIAASCCMLRGLDSMCFVSRLCNNHGKCLFCIPADKGFFALTILNAIVNGLILLTCIVYGSIIGVGFIRAEMETDPDIRDLSFDMMETIGLSFGVIIGILGAASLIAFIFSVLLCNGIYKKRPGQINAYFWYGVVVSVLVVLAALLQMACADSPQLGILALTGIGMYSLFLIMVRQTYTTMCEEQGTMKHIRLAEQYA